MNQQPINSDKSEGFIRIPIQLGNLVQRVFSGSVLTLARRAAHCEPMRSAIVSAWVLWKNRLIRHHYNCTCLTREVKSATLYIDWNSDTIMSTMAVRVSLYPKMVETVPQRHSKHPIGKKIREYSKKYGVKAWVDLVLFSSRESIPLAFEKNIVEATSENTEYGEGQIEGHFSREIICKAMEHEGWTMIAIVQVNENWIEIYFGR